MRFIAGLGGIDARPERARTASAKGRRGRLPGLHLNPVWGYGPAPSEITLRPGRGRRRARASPASAATRGSTTSIRAAPASRGELRQAAARNFEYWRAARASACPTTPTSAWLGPSPRTEQGAPVRKHGYPWTAVLEGNTPDAFSSRCAAPAPHVERPEGPQKVVTINAWNGADRRGSYLLPDKAHGTAYLEAIARVFGEPPSPE